MWRHYLKVAFRSLATDRFFTFVNLTGLSVGLAAVTAIFLHVSGEISRDAWLPNHETLYRVDTTETHPGREPLEIARAPGPVRDALLKDFPEVAAVSRAYPIPANLVRDGQPFREEVLVADPNFIALTGLPLVSGNAGQALSQTGLVVLSRRAAEKYFGTAEAVGQRLTIRTPEPRDFVVSAVFETLPENSHMAFDVVIPFQAYFEANTEEIRSIPTNWGGAYFYTYARLRPDARAQSVEARLPAFVDRNLPGWLTSLIKSAPHEFYRFRFIPIADVHFDGGDVAAMKPLGSRTTLAVLSGVALLILGIAAVNFANLTTARSTLRAKEVALRKVVGASRQQIFVQFLGEAVLMTALAGLLGLALVELTLPYFGDLLGLSAIWPMENELRLWAGLIFVVLVTAILSGFYPAVVVSRIRPAAVFNRDYALRSGGAVSAFLVVAQFAISIALIAVTTAMVLQMRFAREVDLGFDKRSLLVIRVPDGADQDALARSFETAVAQLPGVIGVTLSSAVPSDQSEDNISVNVPGEAKPVQVGYHRVDGDFFRTYGVRPLAGRTSSMRGEVDGSAGVGRDIPAIVNASALKRLALGDPGEAVGRVVRSGERSFVVQGVVPDVHFRSIHEGVRDEIYALDEAPGGAVSVRLRTKDVPDLLAAIDRLWADRAPGQAIEREFLDDAIAELYEREERQASLLGIFSAVAIILSCLGLLAMATFAVQRRTKEIAIRKVLGAATPDILKMLVWQFSKPVLLANVIAWPVAWLALRRWLDTFAYRIDVPIAAFVGASAAALLVALAAVGAHALRVAQTSPAFALRHD